MSKVFQPHIQLKLSKDFNLWWFPNVDTHWWPHLHVWEPAGTFVYAQVSLFAHMHAHIHRTLNWSCTLTTLHLKSDVRQKAEVLGVLPEVVHESAVVHVVGKMLRNGEVAETHHFLWSVDGHGFVNTRHFLWWIFLQEKNPQCNKLHNYKVIKHFKWCQVFLKSGTLLFIYCQTFTDVFSQKSLFPRERITSNQPQILCMTSQSQ